MIKQKGAVWRPLIQYTDADAKRPRRVNVVMLTATAAVIGLLLMLAPPAMSRQVGPKAQPAIDIPDGAAGKATKPRLRPKMTNLPARKPPSPKAQTWNDEQRAKILTELRNSFVKISAGEFMMGSEKGGDNEKPVHRVRISRPFEMGKYEVTQAQWEAVMDSNPSKFKGANLPVESVSWNNAQEFIQKLNGRKDGYLYRLPTEAEWEYACRAGTTTEFAFGDSLSPAQANFSDSHDEDVAKAGGTTVVGEYHPNAWGLYDMHGNVYEWCQDWHGSNYYIQSASVDPQGPATGSGRVARGGAWGSFMRSLRSAYRYEFASDRRVNGLGFRLVRTPR